jgi:hypothetical protein
VRAPVPPEETGTLDSTDEAGAARAGEAQGADDQEEAPRISDLRQLGPEGSRLTVLLRVDRLKATPFADAVDQVLLRLPDRRDLLEGTGLELYDSFDALLISTPNPRDPTVTFLAARHHLTDAALRGALDRGARATGRQIFWGTQAGRPFAERHARPGAARRLRDDRIIVMPASGLVVVTPPVYQSLLLARPPRRAAAPADGGAEAGGVEPPQPSWSALLRRIDAEDSLMPPEGIAMVSAVDMFKPASKSAADTAMFLGMEVPRAITAIIGVIPSPFVEVTAEFAAEAEARHWETQWPILQRKLRTNPYVLVSGFAQLVSRASLSREGSVVKLRETATPDETLRLLQLATHAPGG